MMTAGLGGGGGAAMGGGGGGGNAFEEYGGFDPALDPEMAMAVRVSDKQKHAVNAGYVR